MLVGGSTTKDDLMKRIVLAAALVALAACGPKKHALDNTVSTVATDNAVVEQGQYRETVHPARQ